MRFDIMSSFPFKANFYEQTLHEIGFTSGYHLVSIGLLHYAGCNFSKSVKAYYNSSELHDALY